jgi:uncharacterized membrane protein
MNGTDFDMDALGTSLIVMGLAFVFSGLVFMLPSERKEKEDE